MEYTSKLIRGIPNNESMEDELSSAELFKIADFTKMEKMYIKG